MFNIFIYFILMIFMSLIFFFFSFSLKYLNMSVLFEWMLMSINTLNLEFLVFFDWISVLFVSFIFLISSMIMLYSYVYMFMHLFIKRFIWLIILFIFSMVLMVMSPNIISIMFGWDGLGLVSYCLVIFYQNYSSYNSGMVTILSNRVGDIGLLMCICLLMDKGSWSMWMMMSGKILIFMLILAAITKSAQIPFSVWLPMAMAAPTPVSALVHSSTLVTAGVYLMVRFNKYLLESGMNESLFFISILTMFMAGVMAMVELDLKKIIALSTLSQLGLMMMTLSLGEEMLAFFHLLTHAIFKALLFMCVGVIIHSTFNNQDIRLLGGLNEYIPFTMLSFFISNLALSGSPFFSGFFSKDWIMENVYMMKMNIFYMILVMVSLMLTIMYSLRLFYYIFFMKSKKFYSYLLIMDNKVMNMSMMVLMILSILGGAVLNWGFFFTFKEPYLSVIYKNMTLFLWCMGGLVGGGYLMGSPYVKNIGLFYFFSSMWFLKYIYYSMYKPVMVLSGIFNEIDKSWVEFSMKYLFVYLIKRFMKKMIFNIYMFLFMFICFISIIIY